MWRDEGLCGRINHHRVRADRERVGREASPTAAVLDSQSVKTTKSGSPYGYDVGKTIKGRKRQALVDTDDRALVLDPQAADVPNRDGARPVLRLFRRTFPFTAKAFADAGYAGDRPATATIITIEIVRKPKDQVGFAVHPRRWVVERFFGWISRNRSLWKDPEGTLASAQPSSTPPPSRSSFEGSAERHDLSDGSLYGALCFMICSSTVILDLEFYNL